METRPEKLTQTNKLPVSEMPAVIRIPEWGQFPAEKRQELTQILAGMLVRQVQTQGVSHEHPS
jgi:hypothetical protein